MKYDVLEPIYTYEPIFEPGAKKEKRENYEVTWRKVGVAEDIEKAKCFTKHPVLASAGSW